MEAKTVYQTAIYLRLSREDDRANPGKESDSIRTQRELLLSYLNTRQDMEVYDIYTDDGYSGVNFDRPEFWRMMNDIEEKRVNCVLVKDLSRLGRDYIEAGRLIQKTFPAFSVRFIALTDGYDSENAAYQDTSLVVPIKNFINDAYCRDISCKVRSHLRIKRENGKFIGAFTVYGYQKSEQDKNQLIPDAYAAAIVRKIFAWKLEGYSLLKIASMLEMCGILSPMEYKKLHGEKLESGFFMGDITKWSAEAVKRILMNETYTGTLVQGKLEKINYKVKKSIPKEEKDWVKVYKTHTPIVSKEDYMQVNKLLKQNTRVTKGEKKTHMYAGVLFCGECMAPMVCRKSIKNGKETITYICSSYNKGKKCSRHAILQETLNQLVKRSLEEQFQKVSFAKLSSQELQKTQMESRESIIFVNEIRKMQEEKRNYEILLHSLKEDEEKGILSKEEVIRFEEIYRSRFLRISQQIFRQEKLIQALVKEEMKKKEVYLEKLDRSMVITLIHQIQIYQDGRVLITFCYKK